MHFANRLFLILTIFVFFYLLYNIKFTAISVPAHILKIYKSDKDRFSIEKQNNEQSVVCPRPDLRNTDSVARSYMNESYAKECDIINGKNFVLINDELNRTEWVYSITVNAKAIMERTGLAENKILCKIHKFDKKYYSKSLFEDELEFFTVWKATQDNNFTVYVDHGYYEVFCYKMLGGNKLERIYNDQYMILPRDMNKLVQERIALKAYRQDKLKDPVKFLNMDNKHKIERKMNVLHIKIDSISYMHLSRAMPHTYKYLTEELEHNIMFTSANSVGDNTFPNMMPLFSNLVIETVQSANLKSEWRFWRLKDKGYYDSYPFIWYDYESLGYLTGFQEDSPYIGAFNFEKKGFRFRPTSVYARPMFYRAFVSKNQKDNKTCTHGRPFYKMLFDNLEAFLDRMHKIEENKNTPFFYVMFMAQYTHDHFVVNDEVDLYFRNSLEKFDKMGYFDNTMLYIYSDHGIRLGPYPLKTESGKIEKILPFGSLRFPKQLWGSTFEKNTQQNRDRLVTFYDMYQTFRHFLHINANYSQELDHSQFAVNNKNERLERGISVFEPISVNRSCADALIPDNYCFCIRRDRISEESFYIKENLKFNVVVDFILDSINNMTAQNRDICVPFKKQNLHSVQKFQGQHKYQFLVTCRPGNAWFEATVDIRQKEMSISGKILRVNRYGDTADCVKDANLRNYCFCKKLTTKEILN